MFKNKALVLFCYKINIDIINYYVSLNSNQYDIMVVSPEIEKGLEKKFKNVIFYRDDFFLKNQESIKLTHRPNWYYQQFLKYSIVLKLPHDCIHIVDGDSVLDEKYFFYKDFHYSSIKPDPKYQKFTNIFSKQLESRKNYIVNHMVFEKKLLLKLLNHLEVNEFNFVDKFCSYLISGNSWFSEYQNYAMYVLKFDEERKSIKTKVFRRFDLIKSSDFKRGLEKYSLISLEESHNTGILRRLRAIFFYFLGINLG